MFYKLKSFVAFFKFSLFHLIIQAILSVELQRRLKGKQFLCFTIYDKVLCFENNWRQRNEVFMSGKLFVYRRIKRYLNNTKSRITRKEDYNIRVWSRHLWANWALCTNFSEEGKMRQTSWLFTSSCRRIILTWATERKSSEAQRTFDHVNLTCNVMTVSLEWEFTFHLSVLLVFVHIVT